MTDKPSSSSRKTADKPSLTGLESIALVLCAVGSLTSVFYTTSAVFSDEWSTTVPPSNTTGLHPHFEVTASPRWGVCQHSDLRQLVDPPKQKFGATFFLSESIDSIDRAQKRSNGAARWLGIAIAVASVEMVVPLVPSPWTSSPIVMFALVPRVRATLRYGAIAAGAVASYDLIDSFIAFKDFFFAHANATKVAQFIVKTASDVNSTHLAKLEKAKAAIKASLVEDSAFEASTSVERVEDHISGLTSMSTQSYLESLGYTFACGYWSRLAEFFVASVVIVTSFFAARAQCPKTSAVLAVGLGLVLLATSRSNESLRWASRDPASYDSVEHADDPVFASQRKALEMLAVSLPEQVGLWSSTTCQAPTCKSLARLFNTTRATASTTLAVSAVSFFSALYLLDSTWLARVPLCPTARSITTALQVAAAASLWNLRSSWNSTMYFEYCTADEGGASLFQRFTDSFVMSTLLERAFFGNVLSFFALAVIAVRQWYHCKQQQAEREREEEREWRARLYERHSTDPSIWQ